MPLVLRMLRLALPALAVAVAVAGAACGATGPAGYPPIAGGRQVALHIQVVGSGGYDPNNPGLQTDYMALQVPSDGGHYLAKEGDETWFAWSVLFPKGFPTQRGWGVFAAWKSVGVGFNSLANLRLDVTDDVLRLYTSGGNPGVTRTAGGGLSYGDDPKYGPRYEQTFRLGPLLRGVWQTFYLHVRWSQTLAGSVELWRSVDGGTPVRLLAPHRAATLYDDWPAIRYPIQDLYHKGGQPNLGTVADVYQTPMQWGSTPAAALETPSRQIGEGRWFGDTHSSGSLVPVSALPVPLPKQILAPGTAATEPAAPKQRRAGKPRQRKAGRPARPRSGSAQRSLPKQARVVTSPDCETCVLRVGSSGIRASIQGGDDRNDTALWTRAVRPGAPLTVADRVQLGSTGPLDDNIAILQLRDRAGRVLWEVYVASDRSLHLWSPPGSLKAGATNVPLGVLVPGLSAKPLALSLTLVPRKSLTIRVQGHAVASVSKLLGPSGGAVSLRVGIDHYDGSAGNPISVRHSGLNVS